MIWVERWEETEAASREAFVLEHNDIDTRAACCVCGVIMGNELNEGQAKCAFQAGTRRITGQSEHVR